MRGYFGIGEISMLVTLGALMRAGHEFGASFVRYFALACALFAAACSGSAAEPAVTPAMPPSDFSRCEFTIDAIPFACSDGRILSVRHDPEMGCVIVMVEDGTYALPRDAQRDGYVFRHNDVVFTRSALTATFTRAGDAPYENCVLEEPQ